MIFSKVEGLGGPVCKGSRCHWNRPCKLLPVLVENLTAVFIKTWSLDIPVLSRGRDFDWHIVGGYCTTGSLGMCGGIVENKDVVVIGIMPCQCQGTWHWGDSPARPRGNPPPQGVLLLIYFNTY